MRMGLPMGDLAGGMFGAFAVAGALFRRARTGRGAHVDLSLLDCQVSLLTYIAQYFWADGRVPRPDGLRPRLGRAVPGAGHRATAT